jgi:hypothetical protein
MMLAMATTCCKTSLAGPLGVLPVGPVVATTKVEEDVNGRPLGVLSAGPVAATTEVEEDIHDSPPGGAASRSDSGHH